MYVVYNSLIGWTDKKPKGYIYCIEREPDFSYIDSFFELSDCLWLVPGTCEEERK